MDSSACKHRSIPCAATRRALAPRQRGLALGHALALAALLWLSGGPDGGTALAAETSARPVRTPTVSRFDDRRLPVDRARLAGSAESRALDPVRRAAEPAAGAPVRLPRRERPPLQASTPKWEMADFCPERGFAPEVKDCPAGWRRVRVDVSP